MVRVKRNGEWIDAPDYEVEDEVLVCGHTTVVVKRLRVGADGATQVDLWVAAKHPADFVPFVEQEGSGQR